tara:strand:+ start:67 stop:450 length:384 start_codon:yes stop_codon:yes gene_type:complete
MNQIELLRHVADNIEAGRDTGCGLALDGKANPIIHWLSGAQYTLAPRTHKVNGFVVPAPMMEKPKQEEEIWLSMPTDDEWSECDKWNDHPIFYRYLERGLCFTTKEAAQQNALAMLGRDPAKGVDGV